MGRKRAKGADEAMESRPVIDVRFGSGLPLETFRQLALAGTFRKVVISSDWTCFTVKGEFEGGSYAMLSMSKEDRPRQFLNPAAALMLLRKMGILRVEVEMKEWDLDLASLSMRMRPDVTARRLQRKRMVYQELLPGAVKQEIGKPDRKDEQLRLAEAKIKRTLFETRLAEADERHRRGEFSEEPDGRELSNRYMRETHGWELRG